MIDVNDLRKGVTFELDNSLYKVLEYSHNKPGRGNATIRIKARDLRTGTTLEKTFQSGDRVQDVRLDLIQYNEDLSLGAVEGALRSSVVQQALFSSAQAQAISLEAVSFAQAITIERKHSVWEARYRNTDPYIAQTVTNLWMQLGYDLMQSMQASGNMADFVILDPPNYAPLPSEPVAYHLNTLLLAGSMAGLILGVLLAIPLSHQKPQPLGSQHG